MPSNQTNNSSLAQALQNNLLETSKTLSASLARMASGLKILSAKDDRADTIIGKGSILYGSDSDDIITSSANGHDRTISGGNGNNTIILKGNDTDIAKESLDYVKSSICKDITAVLFTQNYQIKRNYYTSLLAS